MTEEDVRRRIAIGTPSMFAIVNKTAKRTHRIGYLPGFVKVLSVEAPTSHKYLDNLIFQKVSCGKHNIRSHLWGRDFNALSIF
ncbi:MAG: hypothetical protein A4E57_00889 [Syntrophorhabdaceae bacterium PtaU1.Bin034]|nr:MAG: hypothetical protein A4E57_00889 [Syntrophorhabdaceae bacterium PtaU1.Bin034]